MRLPQKSSVAEVSKTIAGPHAALEPILRLLGCHALHLLCCCKRRQVAGPRKRAHDEPLDPAAYFDLVARSIAEIDASAQRHGFRDHELEAVGLGEALDAARRIDGIAHRCDRHRRTVTHLADDGRPGMNADTDPQRLWYVVDQRAVEGFHSFGNASRGCKRLAAASLDAAVEAEQLHH